MNTSVTLKRMPTVDMQISDIIPQAGELFMDATSNKIKIGDGKSHLKDLPWVDLSINIDLGNNSAKEESSLSIGTKAFLEDHIDLIENNDYDTLYSRIATDALAQEVTKALLKADLNPKPYLSIIPQSIRHLLEPENVWAEDTARLYTKAEMDAMLDEWNKKLFTQMGIPQNMIKRGNRYGS